MKHDDASAQHSTSLFSYFSRGRRSSLALTSAAAPMPPPRCRLTPIHLQLLHTSRKGRQQQLSPSPLRSCAAGPDPAVCKRVHGAYMRHAATTLDITWQRSNPQQPHLIPIPALTPAPTASAHTWHTHLMTSSSPKLHPTPHTNTLWRQHPASTLCAHTLHPHLVPGVELQRVLGCLR